MVDRRDIGSWLAGPGSRAGAPGEYPGQGLGMPPSGPGSIARFGRRFVAVLIDWLLCQLIAGGVFGVPWTGAGAGSFVTLAIFAVENVLLVGTIGTTVGHRIMGLQVRGLGGRQVTPVQALARTVLLCLFVPAIIWDRDGRGVHDKVPNTVIVRTR